MPAHSTYKHTYIHTYIHACVYVDYEGLGFGSGFRDGWKTRQALKHKASRIPDVNLTVTEVDSKV